jgi:hypothetical protein
MTSRKGKQQCSSMAGGPHMSAKLSGPEQVKRCFRNISSVTRPVENFQSELGGDDTVYLDSERSGGSDNRDLRDEDSEASRANA